MKPTKKHPDIERFLDTISGRTGSIEAELCIAPPLGCGKPAGNFRDGKSLEEYTISGLCQKCQDDLFGTEEE